MKVADKKQTRFSSISDSSISLLPTIGSADCKSGMQKKETSKRTTESTEGRDVER